MNKTVFYGLLLTFLTLNAANAACGDANLIAEIKTIETNKLLENAPTFRHAWDDKAIELAFSAAQPSGEQCVATMQISLPQQDLDEVNAHLNENPAKRILLGAQGYTIPENSVNKLEYFYQIEANKVKPNNAQNQALNSLHSSLEYMYQTLAQQRIVLKKDVKNTIKWPEASIKSEKAMCMNTLQAPALDLADACSCRIEALSQVLSPRQLELVTFIKDQPYSAATGVLNSYQSASNEINQACGNLSKK